MGPSGTSQGGSSYARTYQEFLIRIKRIAGESLSALSLRREFRFVVRPAVLHAVPLPTAYGIAGSLVQHAVARHGEREPAARAGLRHRADRLGRADGRCDLRIGGGHSEWNLAHLVPNALLQFGAAQVQRQRE